MRGHGVRVFERAARLEIGGDARRAEHMAPELPLEAGLGRAPANHLIRIDAMHRPVRQCPGFPSRRAEEGGVLS